MSQPTIHSNFEVTSFCDPGSAMSQSRLTLYSRAFKVHLPPFCDIDGDIFPISLAVIFATFLPLHASIPFHSSQFLHSVLYSVLADNMLPSHSSLNLTLSIVGGDCSDFELASSPLPPGKDPRVVLPVAPHQAAKTEPKLDLRQYIAHALPTTLPSYSLLLQILAAEMWRKNLHRTLFETVVSHRM